MPRRSPRKTNSLRHRSLPDVVRAAEREAGFLLDLENRLRQATARLARVKNALECPYCQDTLSEPETWRCGHTLCKACWIDIGRKKPLYQALPIECPVCKESFLENPIQNLVVEEVIEQLRG
ncbi:hypothetical protein BDZ89DRAFT_1137703 [Hymenopellis radicata]|nr:hypothetical protein BDZ89DRAFT_1137703 [Hymenopellis radicata]